MLEVCPSCQTRVVPGTAFCTHCGKPLAAFRPGGLPAGELWLGEIPAAYCVQQRTGPVRVVFTDRRVLVLWTGPHEVLPRPSKYYAWKAARLPAPQTRMVGTLWQETSEPVAWDVDYAAIYEVQAEKPRGWPIDREVAVVTFQLGGDGVRMTPDGMPTGERLAGEETRSIRLWVPGEPEPVVAFLRQLPVARVVQG